MLSCSDLRPGLLPLLSQGFEFASSRCQFGLDLGEIFDCRLLAVPLGPKLILVRR